MPQPWNHGISDEILDGIFALEDTKIGWERKQKLERKAASKIICQYGNSQFMNKSSKCSCQKTNLNKGK